MIHRINGFAGMIDFDPEGEQIHPQNYGNEKLESQIDDVRV
ncbi:MAG: hypothetical protein ACYC7D_15365 [Nitrososphaerales archaeon]